MTLFNNGGRRNLKEVKAKSKQLETTKNKKATFELQIQILYIYQPN